MFCNNMNQSSLEKQNALEFSKEMVNKSSQYP